jgi:NAD(P)-dependent dehydrogenase (short-subunit alcohol dehydrogenase family)
MPDLSGKVAIVTGAASGIGKTTSETLARHGASVVVAGHSRDGAEEVAAEIRAQGGEAIGIGVEVTDEEQVKAMVGAAVAKFGGLDCLHNNAAATKMHRDSDVVNVATEVWDETMAVNLRGPFFGCKYAIPEMREAGRRGHRQHVVRGRTEGGADPGLLRGVEGRAARVDPPRGQRLRQAERPVQRHRAWA